MSGIRTFGFWRFLKSFVVDLFGFRTLSEIRMIWFRYQTFGLIFFTKLDSSNQTFGFRTFYSRCAKMSGIKKCLKIGHMIFSIKLEHVLG